LAVEWKGDIRFAENELSSIPVGVDPDGRMTAARIWLFSLQRKFSDALQVLQQFRGETLASPSNANCPKAFLEGILYQHQGDNVGGRGGFGGGRGGSEALLR